ncbi:transmembrane protein 177 [Rhynchophorus ferrugineus]|uniref:transmembrane protein 177 n=1 Tax=Rhynchophorus ferrugineus TaxID=354439 RepID=UPI003FCCC302
MPIKSNWFLSDAGKYTTFILAGIATTTVNLMHVLPNTVLLEKYKDLVRLYSKGFTVPVPEKLLNRFTDTLDLLKIPQAEKLYYKPFMVCGFNIFGAGFNITKFGVAVGLPHHYVYDKIDLFDRSKIKVNGESVVWESDAGKELLNSLILSENAQKFAIARTIKHQQSPKLIIDTILGTASCLFTYSLSRLLNVRYNLYQKAGQYRFIMYTLVGSIFTLNYFLLKDATQLYYDQQIDKELKDMHSIFAEGGKEYYTKILQRNIALRQLMGKEGEQIYTVTGNDNYMFRTKHLPLVHRKKIFDESSSVEKESNKL